MRRIENATGKSHVLSKPEVKKIYGAIEVVEELAFFYRNETEGNAQAYLLDLLRCVAAGLSLAESLPEDDS